MERAAERQASGLPHSLLRKPPALAGGVFTAPFLPGVMRQQSPIGMPHPARARTPDWPSGSAVFVCTPTGGRMEAGRVVLDGVQWRVWLRQGTGYRDRGTAPQRSAAVMAMLDAATRPRRGAKLMASMRLRSFPSVPRARRPWRSVRRHAGSRPLATSRTHPPLYLLFLPIASAAWLYRPLPACRWMGLRCRFRLAGRCRPTG
jgi:hypothetical protein